MSDEYPKTYIVLNSKATVRKTMSTLLPNVVEYYDNGREFPVWQTHQTDQNGVLFTWGRINRHPDQNQQNRYICLAIGSRKLCVLKDNGLEIVDKEEEHEEPLPNDIYSRLASLEGRVAALEGKVF